MSFGFQTASLCARRAVSRGRRVGARGRGFTLVELLVVISIIGMLMALLLPAIQNARETGRQNTCRNNIKNLATALFNYSNRTGTFPGYMNALQMTNGQVYMDPTTSVKAPVSWVVMILPDIDRAQLFDQWRRPVTGTSGGGGGATASQSTLQSYRNVYLELLTCPSDPQPNRNGTPTSFVPNTGMQDLAAATTGTGGTPRDWAANGMFFDNYTDHPLVNTTGTAGSRGQMVYMRDEMVRDPKDKTILLTENVDAGDYTIDMSGGTTAAQYAEIKLGSIWVYGTVNTSMTPPQMTPTLDSYRINVETGKSTGALDTTGYAWCRPSSRHPQMVNVAFVGQNVLPLRDSISYFVFAKLMASDDDSVKLPGQTSSSGSSPIDPNFRMYQITDSDISQ